MRTSDRPQRAEYTLLAVFQNIQHRSRETTQFSACATHALTQLYEYILYTCAYYIIYVRAFYIQRSAQKGARRKETNGSGGGG